MNMFTAVSKISQIGFIIIMIWIGCPLFGQNMVQIAADKDNTLYESATGTISNGAGEYLFAGTNGQDSIRRALIAWNVAGNLPAGVTIDSATLQLYMSRTSAGVEDVQIHRVLSDWGEGTSKAGGQEGAGAPAAPGDASWVYTFYDTVLWVHEGGDFSETVSAVTPVDSNGFYIWGPTSQMTADVQNWLDAPGTNFGWIVIGNESVASTAKRFDSREYTAEANRPLLTIYYRPSTAIAGESHPLPERYSLLQNYPNPFNPTTSITFTLPTSGLVTLRVMDVTGKVVATLANGKLSAGRHSLRFDGSTLSSGIYFYTLEAGRVSQTKRMLLLK